MQVCGQSPGAAAGAHLGLQLLQVALGLHRRGAQNHTTPFSAQFLICHLLAWCPVSCVQRSLLLPTLNCPHCRPTAPPHSPCPWGRRRHRGTHASRAQQHRGRTQRRPWQQTQWRPGCPGRRARRHRSRWPGRPGPGAGGRRTSCRSLRGQAGGGQGTAIRLTQRQQEVWRMQGRAVRALLHHRGTACPCAISSAGRALAPGRHPQLTRHLVDEQATAVHRPRTPSSTRSPAAPATPLTQHLHAQDAGGAQHGPAAVEHLRLAEAGQGGGLGGCDRGAAAAHRQRLGCCSGADACKAAHVTCSAAARRARRRRH